MSLATSNELIASDIILHSCNSAEKIKSKRIHDRLTFSVTVLHFLTWIERSEIEPVPDCESEGSYLATTDCKIGSYHLSLDRASLEVIKALRYRFWKVKVLELGPTTYIC